MNKGAATFILPKYLIPRVSMFIQVERIENYKQFPYCLNSEHVNGFTN